REIVISDTESLKLLKEKISGADEGEAAFILHLVRDQEIPGKAEMIHLGLKHNQPMVQLEAMKMIHQLPREDAAFYLHQLLQNEKENISSAAVIAALKSGSPGLRDTILESLQGKNKTVLLQVFEASGEAALPVISDMIREIHDPAFTNKLIKLIGRIGGLNAL